MNKQKTKILVKQVLENLTKQFPKIPKFLDKNFQEIFREYRGDGTDNIRRDQMCAFVKKVAHIKVEAQSPDKVSAQGSPDKVHEPQSPS